MTNTAANEKRIAKMARYEARKIMSLRRSRMNEMADQLEAEAVSRAERMRAGLE